MTAYCALHIKIAAISEGKHNYEPSKRNKRFALSIEH